MRFLTSSLLIALLVGCSGSSSEPSTPEKPTAAKKNSKLAKAKNKPKAKKPGKAKRPEVPVMRTARFEIPLSAFDPEKLEELRAKIVAAHAASQGDDAKSPDEKASQAWKCRVADIYEVEGEGAQHLRLVRRLDNPECTGDVAESKKWEVAYKLFPEEKPADRKGGGEFDFQMLSELHPYDPGKSTWGKGFAKIFKTDTSGTDGQPYPHDDAWLGTQLPEGSTLSGKKGSVDSRRWAVVSLPVAGEKLTVEAETWSCRGKDEPVGAILAFRSEKKAKDHSPNDPKDVAVHEKLEAFAAALAKELGDEVGGTGLDDAKAIACGG